MSTAGVGEGHTHDLPEDLVELVQSLGQRVRRGTAINVITLVVVGGMVVFLALFIVDRGEERDRQSRETNQRINDAICDLLDQLPEGPLLDRPRDKYGCGPGIPLEDLPPEQAEQLRQQRGQTPAPSVPAESPAVPPQAAPGPPPAPEPSPPTDPPPLINLGPVGGLACDLVRACF
jgi:hypothetical protein